MAARRAPSPPADLFGNVAPAVVPAPRARTTPRKAAAVGGTALQHHAPVVAPPVDIYSIADPVDRAWARVAAECPNGKSAEAHRHGEHPLVHVCPMDFPTDIYCEHGEEVPGYPGFYRPDGGHRHRHPKSVGPLTDEQIRDGEKMQAPLPSMKTSTYKIAEMTGRARTT